MGRLGWAPETFWNARPMDLVILGEGQQLEITATRAPAMTPERFKELQQLYPD